jgi:peptidoglycan hydrolase CwlO-like protein
MIILAVVSSVALVFGIKAQHTKRRTAQLLQEKERLLKDAVEKLHAIIMAQENDINATKEKSDYIQKENIRLQQVINDLQQEIKDLRTELGEGKIYGTL